MDMIEIWVNMTNADVMVLSETWLKTSTTDDRLPQRMLLNLFKIFYMT